MINASGKLTPAACTRTTACPGPATGSALSSRTRVSGSPQALHTSAFIFDPPYARCSHTTAAVNTHTPGSTAMAVRVLVVLYPNGRFAWIPDPEGNKIELWEPKH